MALSSSKVVSVLLCFADRDRDLCQRLEKHLFLLKECGWIACWSSQQILAGMQREREIESRRQTTDLFLLLISPDFYADEGCRETMRYALQRAAEGSAIVVPILLRAFDWERAEFHALQVLPRNQVPVASWSNRDQAFQQITEEIWAVVDMLRRQVLIVSALPDRLVLTRLTRDLEARRVSYWIRDNATELHEIRESVRHSSAVILIASPETYYSSLVRDTLEWALISGCQIILFWVPDADQQPAPPPEQKHGIICINAHPSHYDRAFEELLSGLRQRFAVLPLPAEPAVDHMPRNPYKSLRPFSSIDQDDFFGREELVEELVATLKEILREDKRGKHERLLAVMGASGSGKSSVVMAGLLPQLRRGALPASESWLYLGSAVPDVVPIKALRPGADPIESLATALADHFPERSLKTIREDLEHSARSLHQYAILLARRQETSSERVVLIVDQFEELFIQTAQEEKRCRFLDLLITAVTAPGGPLLVILTLRVDFYDRVMQHSDFYHLVDNHHCAVLPMEISNLRRVIEQPAALPDVQLRFESDLVSDLLFEVRGQAGALPLLQFTLDQLYQKRSSHFLTRVAYQEIGGIKGALSQHVEKTYRDLPTEEHRRLTRRLFLRLVAPGVIEQETTKRRARLSELEVGNPVQTRLLREVAETFIAERLLTADEVAGEPTIEVGHEIVLREWPRLAGWIHEAQEDLRFQQALSADVAEWEQQQARDLLYRGSKLREAQAWTKRNTPSKQEMAFLHAGAIRRRQVFLGLFLSVLLVISLAGTIPWLVSRIPPSTNRVTNMRSDGAVGSLRWCLEFANPESPIIFAPNVIGTLIISGGELRVSSQKKLILQGPGRDLLTIHSNDAVSGIDVTKGASLRVTDLSFTGNKAANQSLFTNEGTLTLDNSTISGNIINSGSGSTGGGGISNSGTLYLNHSTVTQNYSDADGGGIFNSGVATIDQNTIISGNFADGGGGGISNEGQLNLSNSVISDNHVDVDGLYGGGIANKASGTIVMTNSTVSSNFVNSTPGSGQGGGIYNDGKFTLTNGTVTDNSVKGNSTSGDGGGIYNSSISRGFIVAESTISDNAASNGGGIYNESGALAITNSTISSNGADYGGGIMQASSIGQPKSLTILFCTIYHNYTRASSGTGGSLWIDPHQPQQGDPVVEKSIIVANQAPQGPDISGSLITKGYNLIQDGAGAIFVDPQKLHNTDQEVRQFSTLYIASLLGNNGGPTFTYALLPGSPAIGAIPLDVCDSTGVFMDQRGMKRPGGKKTACDIGAYESQG